MKAFLLLGPVAILLVGCGIPLDSGPEVFDLEEFNPPVEDGPTLGEMAAASMYLVRDEALMHVTRDLALPLDATTILTSLFDDVTEPEVRANLRTAIPPEARILGVTAEGTILCIDVSREFAIIGGEEEIFAVAQIVLTASHIEGVEAVTFELEGVPTPVPFANGALSVEPVSADDYASLVAP